MIQSEQITVRQLIETLKTVNQDMFVGIELFNKDDGKSRFVPLNLVGIVDLDNGETILGLGSSDKPNQPIQFVIHQN